MFGVLDSIGERQGRTPRAAEDHPFVDAEVLAERFDVFDKMLGGVVLKPGIGLRASGAPLVENDDTVEFRVEKTPMRRIGSGAGSAVQENHRHPGGISRLFPIHFMAAPQRQHTLPERLDFGVKGWSVGVCIHDGRPPMVRLQGSVDNVGQQLYHLFGRLGDRQRGAIDFF